METEYSIYEDLTCQTIPALHQLNLNYCRRFEVVFSMHKMCMRGDWLTELARIPLDFQINVEGLICCVNFQKNPIC